ncbi:MAG: hypothetical protein N2485_02390 [bacterium]|nr:hypothetical protein [bacterium]
MKKNYWIFINSKFSQKLFIFFKHFGYFFVCFLFFYSFYLSLVYSYEVKVIYFYEDGNYFVFYYPNSLKLFVDINSGYVIKPDNQDAKINFVSYILDTKSFISRDEDVFTKLYLLKKAIGFNFNDVEPSNVDYFSWSNLTYKYLIIFLKNVENSITITIPAWENLNEADKKEIIEKYRLVFGTSFNEPRYLPYEITFKKDVNYYNVNNEIYKTEFFTNSQLYSTDQNFLNKQNSDINTTPISDTFITTNNLTTSNLHNTRNNRNTNLKSNNNFISFIYENKIVIFSILFLFFTLVILFLSFLFIKKFLVSNVNSKMKYNEDINNDTVFKDTTINNDLEGGIYKSLEEKIEKVIQDKLNNIQQNLLQKLDLSISELTKRIENIENNYLGLNNTKKDIEFNIDNYENIYGDQFSDNDLTKYKKLDPENLEIFMFKVDNIISKLKFLENYRDYNINEKATKIIFKLQELKARVRASKTVNMSMWEDLIKTDVIEFISLLDRYLISIDYNPNISKIREDLLNSFDLEEIEVIVGTTKVNIVEHKVEGYSRNTALPNGIITDLKEKGYKYRGIVLKRAKVIENRV